MAPWYPWLIVVALAAPNEEAFRSQVRPTEPLAPSDQLRTFHVPPGFEVQLFAAEPDIQKPMNMAFDGAGRLWVSGSIEYPYAAAGDGRDTIKVLEDRDGDGHAETVTTFAEGLNIPIGLYPYRDGVVVYSMPNIWWLRDTDGDGRSDQREVLYGPLDMPRDTHGMQNAFRRGFDGWLYINHGYANDTTIRGRDGSSIHLQSGNTYRVRLDGSRVEQFTWGQVNPFGSTFLPTGDLITADCHSRPLTMLLRGAYYPSFGKPHGGLGFAPDMMEHSHGSTAIAGAAYYTGDQFPAEYRDRLFVGNVMTSRVNQDVLSWQGSTPQAVEQPDLVTSDDPWFRPVDLQVGPDGALYVADFYNRVIGHYEVPLDHPGRDRSRGRIWRIVYRGESDHAPPGPPDLTRQHADQLIDTLAHPSLTRRMLALDQLTDRIGVAAADELAEALAGDKRDTVRVHSLWALHRLGRLSESQLAAARDDPSELVRIHAWRVHGESPQWPLTLPSPPDSAAVASQNLPASARGPLERRAIAEAASRHDAQDVLPLLAWLERVSRGDGMQRYAWRLALRRQLLAPNAWSTLASAQLSSAAREELASIALAVPSAEAAAFLLEYIRRQGLQSTQAEAQLAHLCQHLPLEQQSSLIQLVRGHASGDVPLQLRLLPVLHQRSRERGREQVPELEAWASELAGHIFATTKAGADGWRVISGTNTWGLERRASQDGQRDGSFLSSLPGGERSVGVLRSRRFTVPTQLSFYICGHLGVPNQPANERNYVRLCLADTGEEVVRTLPPRNDTARHVTWQLERYAGQDGYLEIVDGLDLSAYAWLAVARFSPEVVELPAISLVQRGQYQAAACGLVESLRLASLQPQVAELLRDDTVDWGVRAAAAQAWLAFQPRPFMSALARLLGDAAWDAQARDKVLTRVIGSDQDADLAQLGEAMKGASTRLQRQLADALAATPVGATHLVTLMERGQVTSRLLQDPAIKQKLAAAGDAAANERAERLLASLSPLNLELLQLIEQRRRFYAADKASGPRGQEVFRKHCATCHQVAGQGTLIAPQLDGIGQRGLERVIEDVLDPNRNIDETFHLSVIQLVNGRVATGLLRREEGGNLVLANQEGKEFVVAKADMEEHTRARVSLMPANFGELLKADEFDDLVAYLLSLRAR